MILLSIIIPSNESVDSLREFLPSILASASKERALEFILVDASSSDSVESFCSDLSIRYIPCEIAQRGIQMNRGAEVAKGENFFFLHLDSVLPLAFDKHIMHALNGGAHSGCFEMQFYPSTTFLSFFARFTRYHWRVARGGDQGLFVRKQVFAKLGGFREDLVIMEDMDICHRLEKYGGFEILIGPIITSSRKYQKVGQWKLQSIYFLITILHWCGLPNPSLMTVYKRLLGRHIKD